MVKKKGDDNQDLTRIEDLSEFLHQEDSDLDSRFDTYSPDDSKDSTSTGVDLNSFDEDESPPELPQLSNNEHEQGQGQDEEVNFESSSLDEVTYEDPSELQDESFDFANDSSDEAPSFDKTSFGENPFGSSELNSNSLDELEEVSFGEITEEANLEDTLSDHENHSDELHEEEISDTSYDELADTVKPQVYTNNSEKFEDVKTFAQNFSYGKASAGGGNPPYTIIARNIKYQDDADNILDILSEFGLINDQNRKDTEKTMEFGALIIPQISEYTAIVIAHKLRRFDLDLQVGLSDEVHPSKSGMDNPRGLLKKDNLKQNKSESLKFSELNSSIKDIIISTTSGIPGYFVENYIGVQTTFTIVEEAELEKLQYVARAEREKSELFDFNGSEVSTEKIFQDYQNSFNLLYADLTMQLKQKAFTQHANALLGLTFQLSPLQFDRTQSRVNAYQITCSATLAIVGKEKS